MALPNSSSTLYRHGIAYTSVKIQKSEMKKSKETKCRYI